MSSSASHSDATQAATATQADHAVQLHAAGFNGHHQLFAFDHDVRAFTMMLESSAAARLQVLFAGWSTTVIEHGSKVFSLGHQHHPPECSIPAAEPVNLKSSFGDHNGMSGILDDGGHVYLVGESEDSKRGMPLSCRSGDTSPKLGTIAMAGNERVALTFRQAPNGNLAHVVEFASFNAFIRWFEDPSGEGNYPECHHMFPGRPKQLLANTATFLLLTEGGEVYTWGDSRYQSLGRAVTGDPATPADKPGVVEALGGLQIVKVASAGWINAALSADGALYVWGSSNPGSEGAINCLQEEGPGQVVLVNLPSNGLEPLDILDVAVGDNHIAVVAEGQRLFVVGENKNGQLGLGSEEEFFEDWQEVSNVSSVKSVWCGPKSTFVLTE